MTSRERVLMALNHEEPDRVPLFVDASGVTTLLEPAYRRLDALLGVREGPRRWIARQFGYVRMDEDVLQRLGSDGRVFAPGPAPSAVSATVSETCLVDAWGGRWEKNPGSLYFEVRRPPLKDATLDDLDRYPWPDLAAPARFEGPAKEARAIQQAGYASVCMSVVNILDLAPGGGYIASAVHCIQPDVPPENVVAMCDEVKRFGKYPIAAISGSTVVGRPQE